MILVAASATAHVALAAQRRAVLVPRTRGLVATAQSTVRARPSARPQPDRYPYSVERSRSALYRRP